MKKDIFSLKGKTALVTGGRQGIGKVVAGYLADAGANIAICDIKDASAAADEIAKEYGVKTASYTCDVTKPEQVRDMIAQAAADMGALDILFNNAGVCLHKEAVTLEPEEWLRVIDVNLNGVFFVANEFAKYLIANKRQGSIINTASMSGSVVNYPQRQASYNSSKAGVIHLTKSLAVEWADYGIRVNCISPGYMWTEMCSFVREDWRNIWTDLTPFKRMGKPEELAGAVIYLASDASTFTSGSDIIIDGCYTAV